METTRLYKIAENSNIIVDFRALPHTKAFCISHGGKKYIAMDKNLCGSSAEERVALAHELGHCKTEGFYSTESPLVYRIRFEKKAELWAILNLIPKDELLSAIAKGNETVSTLAEHFSVTEEFMQKAIKYYSET